MPHRRNLPVGAPPRHRGMLRVPHRRNLPVGAPPRHRGMFAHAPPAQPATVVALGARLAGNAGAGARNRGPEAGL